jgi:hypothetical protein
MPVTLELCEDGHVAYYIVSDPWQTTDLTRWYAEDNAYRNGVDFKVHTFMNMTQVKHVPSNIISARVNAPAFTNPHSGQLVMIGAFSFVKTMAEMIFRLAHYERAKFFNIEQEGWTYIRQVITEEMVVLTR